VKSRPNLSNDKADPHSADPGNQLAQGASATDDPSSILRYVQPPFNSFQTAYGELRKVVTADFKSMRDTLAAFGGKECRLVSRQFPFMTDPDLKKIVERDYRQLSMILFPGAASKATVIMAGSILEAILYDQLAKPAVIAGAMAASKAPTKKGPGGTKVVRDLLSDKFEDDWKLQDLIEVAVELAIVSPDREKTIDKVLRDFRNFVHARKELKSGHAIGESEAGLAKYGLDAVCDHLK
jgi:hypothetical protein